MDNRFRNYKYCEVIDVYKKMPEVFNKYLIKISVKKNADSLFGDAHEVYIQSSRLREELIEILNKTKETTYLSYGMADIDVTTFGDHYVIQYSPSDSLYADYHISKEDFIKLIDNLK